MKNTWFARIAWVLIGVLTVGLASCTGTPAGAPGTDAATAGSYAAGESGGETATHSIPNASSGTFSSDSGSKLRLLLDYSRVPNGDGTDDLTLILRLSSYSLSVGERPNLGRLTAGEQTVTFSTPALEITENTVRTETPFFTHTFRVATGDAVAVSAVWPFRGVYAGVELQDLTVSGTVA